MGFPAAACLLLVVLAAAPAWGQVAGAPKPATPAEPPKTNVPSAATTNCTTTECHQGIAAHTVRHNPTAECATCHVQVGSVPDHKFALVAPKEDLCRKCHQLQDGQHRHAPVVEGKCMECHDPHGSEHKSVLRGDPNRDLCLRCHNQEFQKKAFVHGPVAVGACSTCHAAHSSNTPRLLLADANALCKTCHADTGNAGDGVHVHKALEQGCVNCHDAHSSDHKFQLRDAAPQLCLSCHKEKFDAMTAKAVVVHGAVMEEGGCTTCHEPHSSKLAALQRGSQPDTCLKCHDKPLKGQDGRSIDDMAKVFASNPIKHGPIRDGHCTVCHNPHAGEKFRLLSDEYPSQFYSPFSLDLYALCFKCHSAEMVTQPKSAAITQFRNGAQNLHALHVNQTKGRTCRACHEVHASKRHAHIRDSVPFGSSNWLLDINFTKTESGGSCAPGCHAPKTYSRDINALTPAAGAAILSPPEQGALTGLPRAGVPRAGGKDAP